MLRKLVALCLISLVIGCSSPAPPPASPPPFRLSDQDLKQVPRLPSSEAGFKKGTVALKDKVVILSDWGKVHPWQNDLPPDLAPTSGDDCKNVGAVVLVGPADTQHLEVLRVTTSSSQGGFRGQVGHHGQACHLTVLDLSKKAETFTTLDSAPSLDDKGLVREVIGYLKGLR